MKDHDEIGDRRDKIDQIDEEIIELINRRLLIAKEIGTIKAKAGTLVFDSARESEVIKRLRKSNTGPLSMHALGHIFAEVIAATREVQRPQQIAYLGPEATFTHIAAINHFGRSVTYVPQTSIQDIFCEVEKGAYHFGVVPVENSIEGAVNYTLDLFAESDLKICAEIYHSISQDLLSKSGSIDEIQTVYSHPQAFAQCRRWLRDHLPNCVLKEISSTAEAARKASEEEGTAAIASREAARLYNLTVVASKIEDMSRNITRFLVIGGSDIRPTGRDKTSIMFVSTHVPGALYRTLQPFAEADINMVKLESRPSRHENWSYMFFADVEGHMAEPKVKETIDKMKSLCLFLKWLGSYPRAQEESGELEVEKIRR